MPWAPCSPHPVQAVLLSLSRPSPLFVRLAPITECLFLSCRVVSAHLNTSAACSFCFSGLKLIVQPAYPPAQQFSFRFPLGEYSPARVSHSYHVQSARAGARVALGLLGGLENRLSEEGLLNSEGLLGRDPDPQVWPSKVEDGARAPHHLHPHHCQNTDSFVLGPSWELKKPRARTQLKDKERSACSTRLPPLTPTPTMVFQSLEAQAASSSNMLDPPAVSAEKVIISRAGFRF